MRKPLHPCADPRCATLIRSGSYCSLHGAKSHVARGKYGSRWERYAKAYLRKNIFCADPFHRHPGQLVAAQVVGHRIPFKDDERLKWNPANHYALCDSCNSYQCAKFEGGFGNKAVPIVNGAGKANGQNDRSATKAQAANEYPPSVYAPPKATAN